MPLDPTGPWTLVGLWLAGASLAAFALAGWDKSRARRGRDRIPEATLLLAALVGGSPGLVAGMVLFRHKTRKLGFKLAVTAIVAVQVVVALLGAGIVPCSTVGLGRLC